MDKKIVVLDGLDHIRKRPGMYIGSVYSPDHLVTEILDNAIDELSNNRANEIHININESNVVITDDGGGIPRHSLELPDGNKMDSIIASTTKLFSGGKFDDLSNEINKGLHGVGLVVVNAFSKTVRISVKDKENKKIIHDYTFEDGKFINEEVQEYDVDWSTRIEFNIDNSYFTIPTLSLEKPKQILELAFTHFPKSKLYLNDNIINNLTKESFVRQKLELTDDHKLFKVENAKGIENIIIYFTYDNSRTSPLFYGDVNLGMCNGTYLTNFATIYYKSICERLKKNIKLTRSNVLNGFKYYISLTIKNPTYEGQIKTVMSKDVSQFINNLKPQISIHLNNQFFQDQINLILESLSIQKVSKVLKNKRKRTSTDNPIKDCINVPGKTLFILEGDSAGGTLQQIRDNYNDAIFPLTGKILNSINKNIAEAVESKKIKFLLEALGIDVTKKNQNYRYDKIKIICDADPDGMHIVVLVSICLWKYCSQLIDENRVAVLIPPLYGATKKGTPFIPIYKFDNVEKYKSLGYNITRFKGLGEMNPDQLKTVIYDDPKEYILKLPTSIKESDIITACLTNTDIKKRICQEVNKFNIIKLLEEIN